MLCSQLVLVRFYSPSEGSIFDFDSRGRSTVKSRIKLQTLNGSHEFSEQLCLLEAVNMHLSLMCCAQWSSLHNSYRIMDKKPYITIS